MKRPCREECLCCSAPDPDWDEDICVMCWEAYTGEQWCRTMINGKPMELFHVWMKRIQKEAFHRAMKKKFNKDQMVLPLVG